MNGHWSLVTLAVCAIICTAVYILDMAACWVRTLRHAGEEDFKTRMWDTLTAMMPNLVQSFLSARNPFGDTKPHEVTGVTRMDVQFLVASNGPQPHFVCRLEYTTMLRDTEITYTAAGDGETSLAAFVAASADLQAQVDGVVDHTSKP